MKAVILAGGRGTRLLPLSQAVPKHYLPLAEKPAFRYLVQEAEASGVGELVFVNSPDFKEMQDYFSPSDEVKEDLKEKGEEAVLNELEQLEQITEEMEISAVTQEEPSGNGAALLEAKDLIGMEPFAVLFVDDIIDFKTSALEQLQQAFKTSEKPVVGLKEVEKEEVSSYGVISPEKIARRLYKVKDMVEKPSPEQAPSNLAVVGRFVLTPEVLDYLEEVDVEEGEEKTIAHGLEKMRDDGKVIYGKEIKGEWLDCGNKLSYLKSNLYKIVNHPQYEKEINNYLDKIK